MYDSTRDNDDLRRQFEKYKLAAETPDPKMLSDEKIMEDYDNHLYDYIRYGTPGCEQNAMIRNFAAERVDVVREEIMRRMRVRS